MLAATVIFALLALAGCGGSDGDEARPAAQVASASAPDKATATPKVLWLGGQTSRRNVVGDRVWLDFSVADAGDRPIVYTSTPLPDGLVLNPSNGQITGTTTTVNDFRTVVLTATGTHDQGSVTIDWRVLARPVVPPADFCTSGLAATFFDVGTPAWDAHAPVRVLQVRADGSVPGSQAIFSGGWIGTRVDASPNADATYRIDLRYAADGSTGWAGVGIDYLDAQGNEFAEITFPLAPGADLKSMSQAFTQPAGTAGLRVWVYADAGRTVTLEQVQLVRTGCTLPGVPPGTCNRVRNPDFLTDTAGWEPPATFTQTGPRNWAALVRGGWSGTTIDAVAGQRYTATGFATTLLEATSGPTWAGVGIDYLDANDNELGEVNQTLGLGSRRFKLETVAPPGTTRLRLWFYAEANASIRFDAIDFRATDCGAPPPPPPGRCNRILDPGFASPALVGWDIGQALVRSGATSADGSGSLLLENGWFGTTVAGQAGRRYTAAIDAAYTRDPATNLPYPGWTGIGIDFLDAGGREISEANQAIPDAEPDSTSRHTVSADAPAGTAAVRLWVYTQAGRIVTLDNADLRVANCTGQ